jgi:hypothetical protein
MLSTVNATCRLVLGLVVACAAAGASAQITPASIVYRCPGNVYTSDRELSAQQAEQRGCRVIEGAPITVIQAPRARPPSSGASTSRSGDAKVDPGLQRERDSDARRILGDELRREEERLAELRREYNNGEPERRGEERNYQRYLERVAELKAAVVRKEGDIAAIKREIGKLPP